MQTCPNCKQPVEAALKRCPTCGMWLVPSAAGAMLTGVTGLDITLGLIAGMACMYGLWWVGPIALRGLLGLLGLVAPVFGYFALRERYPAFARGLRASLVLFLVLIGVLVVVALGAFVVCIAGLSRGKP